MRGQPRGPVEDVFDFANSAYDVGIPQRTMVNVFALDAEASQFAQKQGIRQIEVALMDSDLAVKPKIQIKTRNRSLLRIKLNC